MKPFIRVLLAFVLFLLPALACNLPVGPAARNTQQVRRTLPIVLFPTPGPGTPIPPEMVPTLAAQATAIAALDTATPAPGQPEPTNPPPVTGQTYQYTAQSGDTLPALASRFAVRPDQISSLQPIPPQGLINPTQKLDIPIVLPPAPYPGELMPDTEIVYGPAAADFDVVGYINSKGGYLSTYSEQVEAEKLSGAEIVRRAAVESSINPRLLLGILDYTSGWVTGQPRNKDPRYPIGFYVNGYTGLSKELSLTIRMLKQGYYGWRDGSLTSLTFIGNQTARLSPQLNAGTVAVQNLLTKLLDRPSWEKALYGQDSFPQFYANLMGDPWARAQAVGPIFPANLQQPDLTLPIPSGMRWSMTGGPHASWGVGDPFGAIDLAPVTGEPACAVSTAWAAAAAPGVVVRSARNAVVIDLDGDGNETTGWELFYFHIANQDRIAAGTKVNTGDHLGHPSCEGGRVTGTHFHVARKYNGEWLPAGEPLPMVLSGWTVHATKVQYEGTLTKGDQVVTARPDGEHDSIIVLGN
jgi:LasA protease